MSFKRKLKRKGGAAIDSDITGLLCCLMQEYRLTELQIRKTSIGYDLTCIPDRSILPPEFKEAYEITAAYMEHKKLTGLSCTSHDNDFEIRIKK